MTLLHPEIKITSDNRDLTGWIEGQYKGHFFQAKVYDEPSDYGIEQGRVSKLCISEGPRWTSFDDVIYNYDRGIDRDHPMGAELAALLEEI